MKHVHRPSVLPWEVLLESISEFHFDLTKNRLSHHRDLQDGPALSGRGRQCPGADRWDAPWAFLSRLEMGALTAHQGVCGQTGSENLRDPCSSLDLRASVFFLGKSGAELRA